MRCGQNLLEIKILEVEMNFHNSSRLDTGSQYILLWRHVIFAAYSIQVVKKATSKKKDYVS